MTSQNSLINVTYCTFVHDTRVTSNQPRVRYKSVRNRNCHLLSGGPSLKYHLHQIKLYLYKNEEKPYITVWVV